MIPPLDHYLQAFIESLFGGEVKPLQQICEELARFFNLTDDDLAEVYGTKTKHYERVARAGTCLVKAMLVLRPRRGYYQITESGREFMMAGAQINLARLRAEIPEFADSDKAKSNEARAYGKGLMNNGKEAEDKLFIELTKLLSKGEGFEIEQQVRWGPPRDFAIFDITVRKNGYLTTVIEVKGDTQGAEMAGVIIPYYVFNHTPASLCIVYNSEKHAFYLYNRKKIGGGNQNVVYYGVDTDRERQDRYDKDLFELHDVVRLIKEVSERQIAGFIPSLSERVDNQFGLHFYADNVLDPQWCREQLGDFTEKKICRYSSLNSLFISLIKGTFRMNGLPGMNDRDEGLFAWNLINNTQKLSTETGKERQKLNNNAFIISYSDDSKIDDLSMWRLYGDDSRGVCCVFSVKKEKLKDRFFLHRVKYIKPPLEGQVLSDPLLAQLARYVDQQSDKKNLDLSPIIYFYKHIDYQLEAEVRLLVDNKKTSAYSEPEFKRDWLLTSSNSIPNPYVDIKKKDFPLELERIILGPNMNDIDTIQVQLETLLNQHGIKAKVEFSKNTSYRNPTNK